MSMTVLQAMHDSALFGAEFDAPTWTAWEAFLAALLGEEMTDEQKTLCHLHTGRTDLPLEAFRRAALICGRRAGKSRVLALLGTCLATLKDYRPYLSAGEVATVGIIAADRKQARTIFRYVRGLIALVPEMEAEVTRETDEIIEMAGRRVVIEIGTASFRATRGYTYAAVLCDEIAFWRDDSSANPDEEILRALRPGLATIPGSMLLLASSPYARRGVLWKTFKRYYGQDGATTLVWKAATREMNPEFDEQEEREAYEEDPAAAAAEYGAEFRNDIASFVTSEIVEACVELGRHELGYSPHFNYRAFVDPSGGTSDGMTLAIAHDENRDGGTISVLDCVREIVPPFSPEAVTVEFSKVIASYHLSSVTGDRYGGEWPREQFRKNGIAYELAPKARSDIYRDLLPKLNSHKVELLDNTKMLKQLVQLERRTARSGRDSIDHAPGGHDDLINAAAGALVGADAKDWTTIYERLAD
ncbi:terminase large subunit domain-containing protein [Acetobacter tropicalis]|uniref:terminase large subunit domain-containing protein n=1 Tax=Acetobacter tropicalis TaxID=104102 RepID=UPI000A37ED41|nr:terminase family protein [Acetobacter tropicalis]